MKSFIKTDKELKIPGGVVFLMNSISEFKGKQELYTRQSPQVLKALIETALIESAESSNRIEGITIERSRLKPIVLQNAKPKDRSEEEVAGYRKALDYIHKNYASIDITPDVIKELHSLAQGGAWDAGKWKEKDNDIIKKYPDGRSEVIFTPVSAKNTPEMINNLCRAYSHSVDQLKYPPLYAIACLILDFLSIHPFRDGNGRVSRLLTLLALYKYGFSVGKYISLERITEESKETYYETLNKSSQGWHDAKHDVEPWLFYFLGTVLAAYREFEKRAGNVKAARGAKTEMIKNAIEAIPGEFTVTDILKECPAVSIDTVRAYLKKLQTRGKAKCVVKGKYSRWKLIR
jgi:Fic family protein